jgi:hypothetical protein
VTRLTIIFVLALAGAVIVLVLFANLLLVATNAGAQTTTFQPCARQILGKLDRYKSTKMRRRENRGEGVGTIKVIVAPAMVPLPFH